MTRQYHLTELIGWIDIMFLTIDVDISEIEDSIVEGMCREDAIELISQIDLGFQDRVFTTELLEKIIESCKFDVPEKGKRDLDKAFKLIEKSFDYDPDED